MPRQWAKFCGELKRKLTHIGSHQELLNPLILGGWVAPNYAKRARFISHLIAAEKAGLGDWASDQLDQLTSEEWLEPSSETRLYPEQCPIFYITGRGGSLTSGFALALKKRLIDFTGREIKGDFLKFEHLEQAEMIAQDLRRNYDKTIIANSYGAYLVLSVLAKHEISLGNVFLTSPITGRSVLERTYFKPAGSTLVETAIAECNFKGKIQNLTVIVGELDKQADPDRCMLMTAAFQGRGYVLPNQGHQISHNKMDQHLDSFLDTAF